MLILGIDTSAQQGSIALLRAPAPAAGSVALPAPAPAAGSVALPVAPATGAASVAAYPPSSPLETIELAMLGEGRASEVLVPAIDALLACHAVKKSSLALIAVASGPGSFTGLRVALATAKGLAEAFAIPAVPVSGLEAVALASGAQGRVVAALDAQRGELFFGEYILDAAAAEPARCVREAIAAVDGFVAALGSGESGISHLPEAGGGVAGGKLRLFTPDEALAARLREPAGGSALGASVDAALGVVLGVVLLPRPTAEDIARIAHRKYLAGFRADVATLDANYLRRSDAEIVSARKPGGVS